jgi:hypothetical protein
MGGSRTTFKSQKSSLCLGSEWRGSINKDLVKSYSGVIISVSCETTALNGQWDPEIHLSLS